MSSLRLVTNCKIDTLRLKYQGQRYAKEIKEENIKYRYYLLNELENLINEEIILTRREELYNKYYDIFMMEFKIKMKNKNLIFSEF